MENNFTKEEIKNSVEYQWRKHQFKLAFYTWLILVGVFAVISLMAGINDIILALQIFLGVTAFYSISLWCCILFYLYKMRYLLKHYNKFNAYEVVLDNVSTSYWYRGCIYYTVSFIDNGRRVGADTNPCFSNMLFSKFEPKDFNNKKVVGLYDSKLEKFYIIKKVSKYGKESESNMGNKWHY